MAPRYSVPRHTVEHPSYETVHARLLYSRGRAGEHICPCGQPALDWAYDHGDPDERIDEKGRSFSEDLEHYMALCRKCHRDLDARDTCGKGHPFTESNTYTHRGRRFCRTCRRDYMRQRRRAA